MLKVVAVGAALLLASTTGYVVQLQPFSFILEDFDQPDDRHMALTFSSPVSEVSAIALGDVPAELDAPSGTETALELDVRDGKTVIIGLAEDGIDTEYSIIINAEPTRCDSIYAIFMDCTEDHRIEIVRQTSAWLERLFNFDRPAGYSILGRRTIEIGSDDLQRYQPFIFPDDAAWQTSSVDDATTLSPPFKDAAIDRSVDLMREIWSQPLRAGPTNRPYADFVEQPVQKKIHDLRNGKFSVSCQGVRDLFLHAAKIRGLNVRSVEEFNYGPQFDDLITYGHSTAEVWSEELEKFVMIDPWMGLTINNRDGVPLSSQEIAESTSADLQITPLLDELRRFITLPNGEDALDIVRPSEVRLTTYSNGAFGAGPGYLTYYRKLAYRDVVIANP